jgi:DNA/RNA endonuclease YhcR with UshA esterase domain
MAIGNPITLTNNVASKTISVTATADQTLFTVTGGYRVNQLSVFRNGVQLSQSSDYTANDGSSVTLVSPANLGDTLLFEIFDTFKVAEAIQPSVANQTINGNLTVTGTLTGAQIGIQSAGTVVGAAKTLNFIGTGNTFLDNGDGTIDVSISGSGGGGLGTAINYSDGTASPFSYIDRYAQIPEDMLLDATVAGVDTSIIVSVVPNIQINAGAAVTVGTGKTMIIDVLQIGDL